eukprot:gene15943-18902_t
MQQLLQGNELIVFVTTTCPFCTKALGELDSNHIPYKKHVFANPEERAAVSEISGKRSVPQGFLFGTFIGGCNDGPESWMGILPLIKNGKLQQALEKKDASITKA